MILLFQDTLVAARWSAMSMRDLVQISGVVGFRIGNSTEYWPFHCQSILADSTKQEV
jgi:hypothetical protein